MSEIHQIDSSIFRDYDIRGVVGKTLLVEDAYLIGKAIASTIRFKKSKNATYSIVLGYDGRLSSPKLSKQFIKGVTELGVNIINIGLVPSPALYYANFHYDNIDGAVIITGSHNPKEYNGFKINIDNKPFYSDKIKQLEQLINNATFATSNDIGKVIEIDSDEYIEEYLQNIINRFVFPKYFEPRIIWDTGNGATSEVINKLVKMLPGQHIVINNVIDGNFPAHHPDPTIKENLTQLIHAVKSQQADLGIAFDGDGDRIGCINKNGDILFANKLLMIFAKDILSKNPKAKIIADVKMSDTCFSYIEENNGIPIMSRTGHSYIKDMMQKEDALLACEMSGHIFFRDDYHGFDDAIYAAVRLLHIMATNNDILHEVDNYPMMIGTEEIKVSCDESLKFAIVEKISIRLMQDNVIFCNIDGVRVQENDGWWLIRASNTQAALIVRYEAREYKNMLDIEKKISYLLQEHNLFMPANMLLI